MQGTAWDADVSQVYRIQVYLPKGSRIPVVLERPQGTRRRLGSALPGPPTTPSSPSAPGGRSPDRADTATRPQPSPATRKCGRSSSPDLPQALRPLRPPHPPRVLPHPRRQPVLLAVRPAPSRRPSRPPPAQAPALRAAARRRRWSTPSPQPATNPGTLRRSPARVSSTAPRGKAPQPGRSPGSARSIILPCPAGPGEARGSGSGNGQRPGPLRTSSSGHPAAAR